MGEWTDWESGDILGMPDWPHGPRLDQLEILRRIAVAFRRVVIDWAEGDRWIEARVAAAVESGYSGLLLQAEQGLRGNSVLVSVADAPGPGVAWVRFYMTPDTGLFELHYEPPGAEEACRVLARRLAEVLGYEFEIHDENELAEPGAAPDPIWEATKQRFPAGRVVRGTVVAHQSFGVFVDLGDLAATGLVLITEFLDGGRMTPEQYPAVGEAVTAVVYHHTDEGPKQIWLCMRPSVLQMYAEPGAAPE